MKVEQLVQGFSGCETCYLSLGFKCFSPSPPKLSGATAETITALHVRSFIRHEECAHPKANCTGVISSAVNRPVQSQQQSGGSTRWNPTQEQIGVLETLYKRGMRTPNAQQIDRITAELWQYGKIEGKNVFYWFQNHKARERQKQKRSINLALMSNNSNEEARRDYSSKTSCKRTCRSWSVGLEEGEGGSHKTLELFPLHPEGR